jgi:Ca2+-binding RTX toxin-like protein
MPAVIEELRSYDDNDQLIFSGTGLTSTNVVVTHVGTTDDLKITFTNIAGSIVLKDQLFASYGLEQITFSDGITWNESQLWNSYLTLGSDTDDALWGTSANDTLFGGKGNDVMTGNAGADSFVFDGKGVFNTLNLGLDRITDFTSGTDKILLSKSTFTALTSSVNTALNASEFAIINDATNGTAIASGSTAKVVFNRANGDLFYNQNGATAGLGSGDRFATLSGGASLAASDILLRA